MPVCLAGMHRSGTSMVAHLLYLCGVYLGQERDLIPATADNPDGHWEHAGFVQLNDRILNALGAGWDYPPSSDAPWREVLAAPGIQQEAVTLFQGFDGREPWGWKDPRNSLTLPFWLDAHPELRFVICVRNPLEVAVSLRRRGLSSYVQGLRLWATYNKALVDGVDASKRVVIHYDAVLSRPEHEIRRLLSFLNIAADDEIVTRAATSAQLALRHSTFTANHLVRANVGEEIVRLYLGLCDAAGWTQTSQAAAAPLDGATLDVSVIDAELGRREIEDLRSAVAAKDITITARDEALQRRQHEITDLQSQLAAALAVAERKDAAIRDLQSRAEEQYRLLLANSQELVTAVRTGTDALGAIFSGSGQQIAAALERLSPGYTERTNARPETTTAVDLRIHNLEAALSEEQRHRKKLEAEAKVSYEHLGRRLIALVGRVTAPGATILMASRGDDTLVGIAGRTTWHFPQGDGRVWSGQYPSDSQDAVAQVEHLKAEGARYLVFPATSRWWLDHYRELRDYLYGRYRIIADEEDTGIILELIEPAWYGQIDRAVAAFEERAERRAAMLDWHTGLSLAVAFPDRMVFSPPESTNLLPHIDRSIDVVVCVDEPDTVAEARRVATSLVIAVKPAAVSAIGKRIGDRSVTVRIEAVATSIPASTPEAERSTTGAGRPRRSPASRAGSPRQGKRP